MQKVALFALFLYHADEIRAAMRAADGPREARHLRRRPDVREVIQEGGGAAGKTRTGGS